MWKWPLFGNGLTSGRGLVLSVTAVVRSFSWVAPCTVPRVSRTRPLGVTSRRTY